MTAKLNLGCGNQLLPEYFGLDITKHAGTHIICDINNTLPFQTQSIEEIYAKSVLEHLNDLLSILTEVERILKPEGIFFMYVPHWSNPFYYSDYTHKHTFGLISLDYFVHESAQSYRIVPVYHPLKFQINSVRLIFESPFGWFRWIMKGFQWLVNRNKLASCFMNIISRRLYPVMQLNLF